MTPLTMPDNLKQADDAFSNTRPTLLERLKDWDDAESWREFFDAYGKLIYRFARKAGLSDAESQDVIQETLLAVAKQMPGFRYDPVNGSFRRWLFNQARWRIADAFRKRLRADFSPGAANDPSTSTGELERVPDSSEERLKATWEAEWRENQLNRALERVKRQVSQHQYQMFHLYSVQRWSMAEIVGTLKVNRAQVYMAKMRVSKLLKAELSALEKAENN
jgi:RNA polymerase sigma factor (sigma-70 family)